jgi:hypothetical protein
MNPIDPGLNEIFTGRYNVWHVLQCDYRINLLHPDLQINILTQLELGLINLLQHTGINPLLDCNQGNLGELGVNEDLNSC